MENGAAQMWSVETTENAMPISVIALGGQQVMVSFAQQFALAAPRRHDPIYLMPTAADSQHQFVILVRLRVLAQEIQPLPAAKEAEKPLPVRDLARLMKTFFERLRGHGRQGPSHHFRITRGGQIDSASWSLPGEVVRKREANRGCSSGRKCRATRRTSRSHPLPQKARRICGDLRAGLPVSRAAHETEWCSGATEGSGPV